MKTDQKEKGSASVTTDRPWYADWALPRNTTDLEDESQRYNRDERDVCAACGKYMKDFEWRVYMEIHDHRGGAVELPSPKLPYICWDCVQKFKKEFKHYGIYSLGEFLGDFKDESNR